MGIYYLYISYHFFFGYKEIPPIKIQLTTNQTWLAGNIIEQQSRGILQQFRKFGFKSGFPWLVSHAGIGLHIHMDVGQNGRPRGPQMLV